MAKKKKSYKKSYKKKKKKSGPKAKPAGMAGGAALSGMEIALDRGGGSVNPIEVIQGLFSGANTTADVVNVTKRAVINPANYKYALVGVLVTSSKNIPVLSLIAKPADRGLKRLTKGKWGL